MFTARVHVHVHAARARARTHHHHHTVVGVERVARGGHVRERVRVGLEDGLEIRAGRHVSGNADVILDVVLVNTAGAPK